MLFTALNRQKHEDIRGRVTRVYLSCGVGPDFGAAVDVHCLVHMLINLTRDNILSCVINVFLHLQNDEHKTSKLDVRTE